MKACKDCINYLKLKDGKELCLRERFHGGEIMRLFWAQEKPYLCGTDRVWFEPNEAFVMRGIERERKSHV